MIPDSKQSKENTDKEPSEELANKPRKRAKVKATAKSSSKPSAKRQSAKAAVGPKSKQSPSSKKETKKTPTKKAPEVQQVEAPKAQPKPKKIIENVIPTVEESAATPKSIETIEAQTTLARDQHQPVQNTSHDQIISAYSIYIAQELYERKVSLRERYRKEVIELKGKSLQFILITIGSERYALDIDCVKEVVPIPTVSKTPNTPEHIKGVANVRGTTYAVFDLAAKFQIIGQEVPRYLLVLSSQELKSGIPLSTLPTNFKINGNEISHSLQTIENALIDASYIKGIIRNEEELIYYMDIVELLKNDKAIVIPDNLVEEK